MATSTKHYLNYEVRTDQYTNESYVRIEAQDGDFEWVSTKVWDRSTPGDFFVVEYDYADTNDGLITADTITRDDLTGATSFGFAENYLWPETIAALEYLINKYEL